MAQGSCYPQYDPTITYTPSGDFFSDNSTNFITQSGAPVTLDACLTLLPTKCFPIEWSSSPQTPYQIGSEVKYNGQNWIKASTTWRGFGTCSVAADPPTAPIPQPNTHFCYPVYVKSSDHQYFEGSVVSSSDGTNWLVQNNAWIQTGSCSSSKTLCYPMDFHQTAWPLGAQVNANGENWMLLTTGWSDQGPCVGKGTIVSTSTTTSSVTINTANTSTVTTSTSTSTSSTSITTTTSRMSTTSTSAGTSTSNSTSSSASTITTTITTTTTTTVTSTSQTTTKLSTTSIMPTPSKTTPSCPTMAIRKDYRDLTNVEKQRFIQAVQKLRNQPSNLNPKQRSLYDDFTYIHTQNLNQVHGQPMFAPWHREMLRRFEATLRSVDSNVALPYYDWGFNAQAPLKDTAIFGGSSTAFGTNGGCIRDGFASGWTDQTGKCVQRSYSNSIVFPDNSQLAVFVINSANFSDFEKQLEMQHNIVHGQIGGSSGHMSYVNLSPNDPLFYMHHANIDRLWYRWQKNHPTLANTYDTAASLDDAMPGFDGLPVSSAMISDNGAGNGIWCIQYQPYSGSGDVLASKGNRKRDDISLNASVGFKLNLTPVGQAKLLDMAVSTPVGRHKSLQKRKPVPPIPDEMFAKMATDPKMIEMMRTRVREAERVFYAATDKLDNDVAAYLDSNTGAGHTEALFHVTKNWDWETLQQ